MRHRDDCLQVHRLARRLRVPVRDKAWAIIGFEEGHLPALPSPSPSKPSTLPPSSPPLPSALTTSSPTGQGARGQTRHPAAAANPGSAARRQSRGALHASHAHGDADDGMRSRSGRMRKSHRVDLVIPESEQQFEEERAAGSAWAAHPAGPEAEEAQVDQLHDDRALATAGRQQPRHLRSGGEQEGRERLCNAAGRGVVVADSIEFGSCMAAASADVQDEVSSADTNDDHQAGQVLLRQQLQAPQTEQHQLHYQPLQPQPQAGLGPMQQQQGEMVIAGLSRAAGGGVEQQAGGAGQLLSGDIQWVGPSIEPPTGLGLTPSHHQTFYAAFARVSPGGKSMMPFNITHLHNASVYQPCSCYLHLV